uniref:Copine domain-containing protein n=1 Tax=Globodera pallida TaxID=36090 RepID=A0A183C5H7_GLOPA
MRVTASTSSVMTALKKAVIGVIGVNDYDTDKFMDNIGRGRRAPAQESEFARNKSHPFPPAMGPPPALKPGVGFPEAGSVGLKVVA